MKELAEAIKNFQNDPVLNQKNLADLLFEKIFDAVKGQKSSQFIGKAGYYQKFIYLYDDKIKETLPDQVKWNDVLKDFSDAFGELYLEVFSKIENNDLKTITVLTKDNETERKKWIRNTLGQVLNNKIFVEEIRDYRYGIDKISIDEKREYKDGSDYNKLEEELSWNFDCTEYINFKKESLRYFEEQIKFQHESFFWCPGELFQDKKLDAKRAVYIAFFYAWLRQCSYATLSDIAEEARVNKSTVSRNWKPSPELEIPFSEEFSSSFPVYFSEESRNSIGIYDESIRCYSGNDYSDKGAYVPIKQRKEILWDIYTLLKDHVTLDFLEISSYDHMSDDFLKDKTYPFKFEIRSNDDIGIHPKKRYSLIYIKTLEVNNGNKTSDSNS